MKNHLTSRAPDVSRGSFAARRGINTFEALVALGLLAATISGASVVAVRQLRLLESGRQYRLAVDEVTNQLEALAALPPAERAAAIAACEPSEFALQRLTKPQLTAKTEAVDDGERLEVTLNWGSHAGAQHRVMLFTWCAQEETP
jgi:type II secretory pathway pseudopilin PulG